MVLTSKSKWTAAGVVHPTTANWLKGTYMAGLEHSFLESWEGWDEVGSAGDLCFYSCKLREHVKHLEPAGTKEIITIFLMSESTVQFDFYGDSDGEDPRDAYIGSKAFKIKAVLEEEIPCDE